MILDSEEFKEELEVSFQNCKKSIVVLSAFIKIKALNYKNFINAFDDRNVSIVVRWQKQDLIANASDLEVYQLCKKKGWRFGIDMNLHGKLFLIDDREVFLGSANLTQRGLHIGLTGNNEFGTRFSAKQLDLDKINKFIDSEVVWMSDELFDLMSNDVLKSKEEKIILPSSSSPSWSSEINELILKPVEFLWVQELIFSSPSDLLNLDLNDANAVHDFELLGLNLDEISEDSIKLKFKRLRLYEWLCSKLKQSSLSFGGLTAALHSAILDDPKPYRVDIKNYNKILFEWAGFLDDTFEVCRPRYAQVISLKSE